MCYAKTFSICICKKQVEFALALHCMCWWCTEARRYGETNMNERSSRSHVLFRLVSSTTLLTNCLNFTYGCLFSVCTPQCYFLCTWWLLVRNTWISQRTGDIVRNGRRRSDKHIGPGTLHWLNLQYFLHHQVGTRCLHISAVLTNYQPSNVTWSLSYSSMLLLSSRLLPALQIHSMILVLYTFVCMCVCMNHRLIKYAI